MPSFDIVSEVDLQEVDNAINQTKKEIATRFDFKGTASDLTMDKDGIHLDSSDDFKMKALLEVLQSKAIKRGLSLKAFEIGKIEPASGSRAKCLIKIIRGIDQEKGKDLVKRIKGMDLKVQVAIQGDELRVSGKKRDDLQMVIQTIRASEMPIPLQFINFRE